MAEVQKKYLLVFKLKNRCQATGTLLFPPWTPSLGIFFFLSQTVQRLLRPMFLRIFLESLVIHISSMRLKRLATWTVESFQYNPFVGTTSGHSGECKLHVLKGSTPFWKYGSLATLRRNGAWSSTGAFLLGGCALEPPSNLNLLAPESPHRPRGTLSEANSHMPWTWPTLFHRITGHSFWFWCTSLHA